MSVIKLAGHHSHGQINEPSTSFSGEGRDSENENPRVLLLPAGWCSRSHLHAESDALWPEVPRAPRCHVTWCGDGGRWLRDKEETLSSSLILEEFQSLLVKL